MKQAHPPSATQPVSDHFRNRLFACEPLCTAGKGRLVESLGRLTQHWKPLLCQTRKADLLLLCLTATVVVLGAGAESAVPLRPDHSCPLERQQSMAEAESHNAAGNEAFKAGDFARATEQYFKAVQADGTVAKYRTNLCNALLKAGR